MLVIGRLAIHVMLYYFYLHTCLTYQEEMQMPQLPPGNITTIAPAAKSNLVPKATQFQGID